MATICIGVLAAAMFVKVTTSLKNIVTSLNFSVKINGEMMKITEKVLLLLFRDCEDWVRLMRNRFTA